jgi:hypothetical protein
VKSPFLIFALKCSIILYFTTCTGINEFTTAVSATPNVTKGVWKVSLCKEDNIDPSTDMTEYSLLFKPDGTFVVTGNEVETTGNWSEDEISNKMKITLETSDPCLKKLNNNWTVSNVSKTSITLLNNNNKNTDSRLHLASL